MLDTNEILHILRNPYSYSENTVKETRLRAADEIERWKSAFENMRDWAEQNGVDIFTYEKGIGSSGK